MCSYPKPYTDGTEARNTDRIRLRYVTVPIGLESFTIVATNRNGYIRQRMRNDLATHAERFGSTELDHIVSLLYCVHLRSRSIMNALEFTHVGNIYS